VALSSNQKIALGFGVFLVLALSIVALVGWKMYLGSQSQQPPVDAPQTEASEPPAQPVMDWKEVKNESLVLNPGSTMVALAVIKGLPSPRIEINAKSPVSVALIPEIYRETVLQNPAYASTLSIYYCYESRLLHTTLSCTVDSSSGAYYLWVKDERTMGSQVTGGILGGLGFKGPAEQELVRNDLALRYSVYMCVENCR